MDSAGICRCLWPHPRHEGHTGEQSLLLCHLEWREAESVSAQGGNHDLSSAAGRARFRALGPSALRICSCLGGQDGEGNGTPLQYSCLENPMDGGAWKAAVHGIVKSSTRLSDFTFTFQFHALEKEMATHSSVLAWRIPGMGEPGGLSSLGSHSWTQLK